MKKLICLLLALALALAALPALADGDTVTIINRDRVNIRDEKGNSMGRLSCYAPVTVHQVKGDTAYITAPRALMEIYKDEYTLNDYRGTYSGEISGWVKTECLSQVTTDLAQLTYDAEECRWELWVEGIYHQIQSYGLSENKNYETHEAPTIDGRPFHAHVSWQELQHWNDPTWSGVVEAVQPTAPVVTDEYAVLKAQARANCVNAKTLAEQLPDTVQVDCASRLAAIMQEVFFLEQQNDAVVECFGAAMRIVPADWLAVLYADMGACFQAVQSGAAAIQAERDQLVADLAAVQVILDE